MGFTALTGALTRWRLLPEVPVLKVAGITAGVGLSFMLCWGVLAVVAAAFLGRALDLPAAWVVLAATCALGLAAILARKRLTLRAHDAAWMALCTLLDTLFAALALWVLLPEPSALTYGSVLAAYTLALGAGLMSNTPGGAGPFDLALLALLPSVPVEDLLAAIIAFRVIYYLIPFVLGAIALLRAPDLSEAPPRRRRADWALSPQSGRIRRCAGGWAHVVPIAGVTLALGDPEAPTRLPRRSDVFYKIGPRYAATLRRHGWHVRRLADEALVPLPGWTLQTSARRRLRQALKSAARAGIEAELATGPLSLAPLCAIARIWARSHGGELGTTVGRFRPEELARQKVVLIRQNGRLIGFVSFNTGQDGWSL
ncbi:MAG: phosphatidylglycerol lysyltransferase domain-containing protein, partial [Pseudomonadota bacterium]